MRKIKFRVWDTGEEIMYPVSQLSWDEHDDGVLRLHFCGSLDKRLLGSFGVHSGFGNVDGSEETGWVLMQFTGLLDKQGKEIYEGDIVRYVNEYLDHPIDFNVVFYDGQFCQDKSADKRYTPDIWYDWNMVEVIGNIYENPELLEAK